MIKLNRVYVDFEDGPVVELEEDLALPAGSLVPAQAIGASRDPIGKYLITRVDRAPGLPGTIRYGVKKFS